MALPRQNSYGGGGLNLGALFGALYEAGAFGETEESKQRKMLLDKQIGANKDLETMRQQGRLAELDKGNQFDVAKTNREDLGRNDAFDAIMNWRKSQNLFDGPIQSFQELPDVASPINNEARGRAVKFLYGDQPMFSSIPLQELGVEQNKQGLNILRQNEGLNKQSAYDDMVAKAAQAEINKNVITSDAGRKAASASELFRIENANSMKVGSGDAVFSPSNLFTGAMPTQTTVKGAQIGTDKNGKPVFAEDKIVNGMMQPRSERRIDFAPYYGGNGGVQLGPPAPAGWTPSPTPAVPEVAPKKSGGSAKTYTVPKAAPSVAEQLNTSLKDESGNSEAFSGSATERNPYKHLGLIPKIAGYAKPWAQDNAAMLGQLGEDLGSAVKNTLGKEILSPAISALFTGKPYDTTENTPEDSAPLSLPKTNLPKDYRYPTADNQDFIARKIDASRSVPQQPKPIIPMQLPQTNATTIPALGDLNVLTQVGQTKGMSEGAITQPNGFLNAVFPGFDKLPPERKAEFVDWIKNNSNVSKDRMVLVLKELLSRK